MIHRLVDNMDQYEQLLQAAENLLALRRHDDALAKASAALEIAIESAAAHVLIARIHLAAENPAEALAAARRSLATDVSVAGLHVASIAQRVLGEYDDSLRLIDEALRLQPNDASLHMGRAFTLVWPTIDAGVDAAGMDSPAAGVAVSAAIAAADHAIALDPELAAARYVRALAELASGNLPAAARLATQTVEVDPDGPRRICCWVRFVDGRAWGKLASRHLAAAGRLDPGEGRALDGLRRLNRSRWRRNKRAEVSHRLVSEAKLIVAADLRLSRAASETRRRG